MDTILYFYQKRGLTAPYVEPVGLKKYMLIRIGLDVRQETWFGVGLTGECPGAGADRPEPFRGKGFSAAVENGGKKALTEAAAPGGRIRRRKIWQLWNLPGHLAGGESGKFFTRKRRHGTRQGKEREAPEEGQEKIRRVRDIMGKLAAEAAELAGEESRIWYVYEDSVRKCLTEKGESPSGEENPAQRQRKLLPSLWEQYFEQKEFADYCGLFWAEQLLEKALLPHFVVLGTADCIFEILERYAGKMKSLRWILPEADCTGEILDFVENFYIEYGLAITLQQLADAKEYGRLRFICKTASNILDFAREPRAAGQGTAEGSIWLDMWSMEEKRHRICGRNVKITYYSLKEKWKSAQRRCNCPVLP